MSKSEREKLDHRSIMKADEIRKVVDRYKVEKSAPKTEKGEGRG